MAGRMNVLHIDFETRSTVDLKAAGIDNYAKHPTTDVWCMAYAFDDEPVEIIAGDFCVLQNVLEGGEALQFVADGGTVAAHKASFELAIWNHICVPRYGWPPLKPKQCRDTMAMVYAMALPGSLDKASAAVGIAQQKDAAGYRLMMQMCRPREVKPDGTLVWWSEPDKLQRLYEYCKQDVRVERELDKRLMPLSQSEQALWVLDQKINNRGITIDRQAVTKAIVVVESEQTRLNEEMKRVTGNFVGFCTETARLTKWVQDQGVMVGGVAKADVLDALDGPLPDVVRDALLLRQEAGKSSTAKLKTMLTAASSDDRLRGMLQFHGAGTGRWAGRKVQLHNMPRPGLRDGERVLKFPQKEIERAIEVIVTHEPKEAARILDMLFGSPLEVVSSCLRAMLRAAPGHDLLAADFANIEGRALAWLAGEEWKLHAFREYDAKRGPDIYKISANRIYGVAIEDVVDDQRQIGKVAELACGYQGGVGAFQMMAKTYLVKVADELADSIKTKWRQAHSRITELWYAYEDAALRAVLSPGLVVSAGPSGRAIKFKVSGSFLWCLLPSGRALCYPYPKVKPIETPWGETKDQVHYMTVDGTTNKWVETHTYGGKIAENVTQAICRDLLAHAIVNAEAAGYPVVLHVHDEVVSEMPKGAGSLEEFEAICARTPKWADGLPVTTAGWRGERYRKG
jgi:DNA polymerase